MDLSVYFGIGVQAENLVSSTKLEWDTSFSGGYYAFKLDMPVVLKLMTTYTIALENFISSQPVIPVIVVGNVNNPYNRYFQQGYLGGSQLDPEGYMVNVSGAAINFII